MWDFQIAILKSSSSGAPTVLYSYTGVYDRDDPAHPAGGSFTYVDANGTSINKTNLWSDVCFSFQSQSAPTNKVGVATCIP
jgi:hypothetical protein